MDVTSPIRHSLQDEHVIGIDPPMKPDLPGIWRRRINPFTGRAISDKALTAEQNMRAGLQRLHGLSMTAGIVDGLQVVAEQGALGLVPDAAYINVTPGIGIARSGEDVDLGGSLHVALAALPVVTTVDAADAIAEAAMPATESDETETPATPETLESAETSEADAPRVRISPLAARLRIAPAALTAMRPIAREIGGDAAKPVAIAEQPLETRLVPEAPRTIAALLGDLVGNEAAAAIPHVGVIVAQPVATTILGRQDDDCPPDPRDDPYADLQRVDGGRLLLYLWPSEMVAHESGPDYGLPAPGPALRNQLAYRIFDVERGFLPDEMHPWEAWGVPLALVGFDADWKLDFIDRAAVVRRGGQPLPRTPMVPQSGDHGLWQARIDQIVEHLAALPDLDADTVRAQFQRVPPVGVLPSTIYDPVARRQHLFPGGFGVDAIPVPRSNLDLALRGSASLLPYNLSVPDRVELLIPVPDPAYEPGLLETAVIDARFATEIAAAQADRDRWLNRREQVRRRYERLTEANTGLSQSWPTNSMNPAEMIQPPGVNPPLIVARTRRFTSTSPSVHVVETPNSLNVAAGDTLWLWVRVQSAAALPGLSLRLSPSGMAVGGRLFDYGVYWGQTSGLAFPVTATNRKVGEVPDAGFWHRLDIPAARVWKTDGTGLAGLSFSGFEFSQSGGDIEWGPFGKDDAAGNTVVWIANEAPIRSSYKVNMTSGPWPWTNVPDRTLDDLATYGTTFKDDLRSVDALETVRNQWMAKPFLAPDIAALDETGLDSYLDIIEGQLKATNDAIDLGFVRARSDIYRVRQFMLGTDSASRLVTSPSLADLAIRDEGARATGAGISKFLSDAVARVPAGITVLTPPRTPTPPPPSPPPSSSGGLLNSNSLLFNNMFSVATVQPFAAFHTFSNTSAMATVAASSVAASTPVVAVAASPVASFATSPVASFSSSPIASLNLARAMTSETSISAARVSLSTGLYVPKDVRAQRPVAGLVERTLSVAERLKPSPAVQALEFAIASKTAVMQTLKDLNAIVNGRTRGVSTDDIVVPGFAVKAGVSALPTVREIFADASRFVDLDVKLDAVDKHESDYFTAAVSCIDNAIALMRLVEGRVSLFENLADDVREARDTILGLARAAGAELRSIDVELAEARHDLATAAALLAEETARVEALNARRQATLADVPIIAYRRVRECSNRDAAPTQEILSGLAETPVASCKREHPNTPPEIEKFVGLLRDAPVKWFPAISREVARIDRIDAAMAALDFSRQFALAMPVLREFVPMQLIKTAPKFLGGALRTTEGHYQTLADRRQAVARLDMTQARRFSLTQFHAQIREASTLGDLGHGAHRNARLAKMASELLHDFDQIAACLNAEFTEVPPIVRLEWAEVLSEFDRPADLRRLSGLPSWGEVDLAQRHALQGLTDWLFAQIDVDDDKARAMINDLVRIALLMAAHAPVAKLIPARLASDSPARVGSRLPLIIDTSQVRAGMVALIRDRANQVVSRAVIDDVSDGRASARIVHSVAGLTTIIPDMRIELTSQALAFGR